MYRTHFFLLFLGALNLAPFGTPRWLSFWYLFWTPLGPRYPPRGPRSAQEELPEGVHFWTPPEAQGALHGGEEAALRPQAQIASYI